MARYKKEIILAAIIVLTASFAFAAGYLANREFDRSPIIIKENPR